MNRCNCLIFIKIKIICTNIIFSFANKNSSTQWDLIHFRKYSLRCKCLCLKINVCQWNSIYILIIYQSVCKVKIFDIQSTELFICRKDVWKSECLRIFSINLIRKAVWRNYSVEIDRWLSACRYYHICVTIDLFVFDKLAIK